MPNGFLIPFISDKTLMMSPPNLHGGCTVFDGNGRYYEVSGDNYKVFLDLISFLQLQRKQIGPSYQFQIVYTGKLGFDKTPNTVLKLVKQGNVIVFDWKLEVLKIELSLNATLRLRLGFFSPKKIKKKIAVLW